MIRSKIVRLISLASVVVMANLGGLGRTTVAAPARAGTTLSLVAYSTPQQAYGQLIPAFQATAAGKDVSFHESFGASGSQSQLVAQGLPADVVEFSLEPDMGRLVNAGIVSANWYKNAYHGFVTDCRGVWSAPGQSEAHPHLGGPDPGGRLGSHAKPVYLGWRALERHGCVRSDDQAAQDQGAGPRLPAPALQACGGAGRQCSPRASDI